MVTFTTNDLKTAMAVAIAQSRGGQWRAIFRGPFGLFQVHEPPFPADLVQVGTANDGRWT